VVLGNEAGASISSPLFDTRLEIAHQAIRAQVQSSGIITTPVMWLS